MTGLKKIAIMGNTSWSVYNFRLGLIRMLKDLGCKVFVIAPKDSYSNRLVEEGVEFVHIDLFNYNNNITRDIFLPFKLSKIYKELELDFIFNYTLKPSVFGAYASALCKIPSISVITGLGFYKSTNNPLIKLSLSILLKTSLFFNKEVWFLNHDDRETFIRKGLVPARKVFVLPSEGVNVKRYHPKNIAKSASQNKITLTFASRLIKEKGVKEFVQAARYFKNRNIHVNFQLIGSTEPLHPSGITAEEVEVWEREGIIEYLGFKDDIRPSLWESDCLVFPSYYGEGVPRILLEAASMGIPIITTENVGCKEVVEDGHNGFLCKSRNEKSLIEKVMIFINLEISKRKELGINGRKKMLEQFSEEMILKYYENTMNKYFSLGSLPPQ
jgi:glycosyltransferase involved in cell wall biosynthesis